MKKRLSLLCLITPLTITIASAQIRNGFASSSLAANDDGSTANTPLGFNINFFGNQRSSAFLNNNGNITFDAPLYSFTPSTTALPTAEIIAPFFGDVDTRGAGSSLMTYGNSIVFGRTAFGITWENVGYFSSHDDKLNSFQLVLIDRSDLGPGDFDIEFNYGSIQWESGDANPGSSNGLGGETARVGYSNGNGEDFEELPGSSQEGALLDGGSNALNVFTNVNEPGRYITLVRNGEITSIVPITNVSASTLRDSVGFLTKSMTSDINRRLLRNRSSEPSDTYHQHLTIGNKRVEIIGSFDTHSMTIDEHSVSNANGLISSIAPESELDFQTSSAGLEMRLNKNFKIGASALFSDGDFKHKDSSFYGDLDAQGLALFATYYRENPETNRDFYFDVLLAKTEGDLNTTRKTLQNYNATAFGESEFNSIEGQLNAGAIFKRDNFMHGPFAQLRIVSSEIDSYVEGGSQFSGGTSPDIDFDSKQVQLGYQATLKYGNLYPQLRVAYEHEFESDSVKVNTLELHGAPESAFVIGSGFSYNAGGGVFAAFDYEYRHYDEGRSAHSLGLSLGVTF